MSLKWRDINEAIEEAERTILIAETNVSKMVQFISKNERIRSVRSRYHDLSSLVKLKRTLKDFNAKTMRWKEQP